MEFPDLMDGVQGGYTGAFHGHGIFFILYRKTGTLVSLLDWSRNQSGTYEMNAEVYTDRLPGAVFGGAAYYRSLFPQPDFALREAARRRTAFAYSERHLQCVWFDPALRPDPIHTSCGERVVVENPGAWNLEAGPDFLGAALRIGPEKRRIGGDVEIHIHPADWTRHGHRTDPRYSQVRVHVCYTPGVLPPDSLPPGAVQICLRDGLASNPSFSFEHIDLTAYPYPARAPGTPCSSVLARWRFDDKQRLLRAAGEERLRRKAERMADAFDARGREQVFYEEFMAGLGYKNNKRPFRHLALLMPLDELRSRAGADSLTAYALLAGVSGLLCNRIRPGWDTETRTYVRAIWSRWWRHKDALQRRQMNGTEWRTDGLRPTNHPMRRMMAAAALFAAPDNPILGLAARIAADPFRTVPRTMLDLLEHAGDPYWTHRLALGGPRHVASIALVGRPRAAALLINVVIPYLAAAGMPATMIRHLLGGLPPEADSRIVHQTAYDLFGPDHPPSLYHDGLARQGLIQIFQDFCLTDRTRCASCPFPDSLKT